MASKKASVVFHRRTESTENLIHSGAAASRAPAAAAEDYNAEDEEEDPELLDILHSQAADETLPPAKDDGGVDASPASINAALGATSSTANAFELQVGDGGALREGSDSFDKRLPKLLCWCAVCSPILILLLVFLAGSFSGDSDTDPAAPPLPPPSL